MKTNKHEKSKSGNKQKNNSEASLKEFLKYSRTLVKKLDCSLLFFSSAELENKYLSNILSLKEDFALLISDKCACASNTNKKCDDSISDLNTTLFVPFPPQINPYESINSIRELKCISSCLKSIKSPIGIEFERAKASEHEKLVQMIDKNIKNPVLDISSYLNEFFSVKDDLLLAKISQASILSDEVFKKLYSFIKIQKIRSEHGAYEFINYTLKRLFLEPAFSPIVANSVNSANIHHTFPSKRAFRKGFLLVDLGVKFDGICSDLSRMIYLGTPSLKEKELYDLVKYVQEKSILYVKEGVLYSHIEDYAKQLLGKYSSYFTHLLGHGLGYYPHECPSFSKISKEKVRKNHVFTIEPGIYFKGEFGIRIEDTCYFDGNKAIPFTKSKKELLLV